MSHFSVLVVGEDVEPALAPFHEFECTGEDNEFVQNVDVTGDYADLQSVIDDDIPIVPSEAMALVHGEHKWGFAVVEDGKLVKVIKRTNPNAQWDWYVVGGRFQGMLLVKPGCSGTLGEKPFFQKIIGQDKVPDPVGFDSARKRDIDFEEMKATNKAQAEHDYDLVQEVTGGKTWTPWVHFRDNNVDHQAASILYREQEAIQAIRRDRDLRYYESLDQFLMPREDYVALKSQRALTFAVLLNGEWIQRGQCGWWGKVSNERDEGNWSQTYWKILDSIPEDALLTVVDCHI